MGFLGKISWFGVITVCAIITGSIFMRREVTENIVLSSFGESGYQGELHHTTTEDGYILGIHRVLKDSSVGKNVPTRKEKKIPILFVHGLESSAADWIYFQGNKSLPYLLLEEGYDIWLGNVRGTQDSYNHTYLNPNKDYKQFWDFSFHEIGYYDLPAMIDYVLKESNTEKLFYVGMSQGEATFLVMASTRPDYNRKIILASLTSPSSHLWNSDNIVLKTMGAAWPVFQNLAVLGLHTTPGRDMLGTMCQYEVFSYICGIICNPFIGYSNADQNVIPTSKLFQVYPMNSALKQSVHYLQLYNSGVFRKFDYGDEENLKRYGSREPPEYEIQNVTAPVAYFWGENDCWSRPKDMEEIEGKLPNLILSYKIPHKSFNHYDLLIAKNVNELAYKKIIETILRYSKKD